MESVRLYLPCFYSPGYKKSSGGTISNYHLVKFLAKFFFVEVITPETNCVTEGNVKIKTIKVNFRGYFGRLVSLVWLYYRACFDSNVHNLRYIFFTNGTSHLLHKVKRKFGNNSKFIILTRAFEDFLNRKELSENKKRYFRRVALKFLIGKLVTVAYENSDIIITNSVFMVGEIKEYFSISDNKIRVLYPPVEKTLGVLRKEINKKHVVGIINPSKSKGEGIFLGLARLFPDVNFYYWGGRDRNFEGRNIFYKGWESDTNKIFSSVDMVIVPSQWKEPFGRVSVESIANKTPCLVSNIGGLPETVNYKWVVEADNLSSWCENIISFFKEPSNSYLELDRLYEYIDIFSHDSHNEKLKEILSLDK